MLRFSGGHADEEQITCITYSQCRIGGKHFLKCVGKNPILARAKSKNDKNISGLLNQVEAGKIGIHTVTNASAYTLGSTNTRIISIEFATKEENHAQFFGQVVVDVVAEQIERTAYAKGMISIPTTSNDERTEEKIGEESSESEETSVSIEVELPATWTEDGKAVCSVTFEFNDTVCIALWRHGTVESTFFPYIMRWKVWCRMSRILLMCICDWRMEQVRLALGTVLHPSAVRQWEQRLHGMEKLNWKKPWRDLLLVVI